MNGFSMDMKDYFCQALDVAMVIAADGAKIGIKGADGYSVLNAIEVVEGEGNSATTKTAYELAEGIGGETIPLYAVRTNINDLKPGDICVDKGGRATGFFIGITQKEKIANKAIRVLTTKGTVKEIVLTKHILLTEDTVLAVRLENALNNPMMLMAFLGDDDDVSSDSTLEAITTMMMFQGFNPNGTTNSNGAFNLQSMLPILMLNKRGGSKSKLMAMMAMQGLFKK